MWFSFANVPDLGLSPVPVATPGRTPRPLKPVIIKEIQTCAVFILVYYRNNWLAGLRPQESPQIDVYVYIWNEPPCRPFKEI